MSIVTPAELRSVLGVSSSLFDDAYLQKIIDTSELVILPLLVSHSASISYYLRQSDVAIVKTITPHNYSVGQSVVVTTGINAFDGTKTVTVVNDDYQFGYANTGADQTIRSLIPQGTSHLSGYDAATIYAANPAVYEAIIVVSVEVFQSITAAGGQIEGVDFQVSPYRMGRSLLNRVVGILGRSLDTGAMLA